MAFYLLHSGQPSAKRLLKRVPELSDFKDDQDVQTSDVVIRWGSSTSADPSLGRVLNGREAVLRTTSRTAMARILKRVGVRVASRDAVVRFTKHYRIPIFDLVPLTCFRSDSSDVWLSQRIQRVQDSFQEIPLDDDKLTTRVALYAVRSLHALGLDHGMVSLSVGPKGLLYVQDVTASPVLDGTLLGIYASAVEQAIERGARSQSGNDSTSARGRILLGTDMEMMLENVNGKMVLASRYLPRKGKVGCDDRSIQFDGKRMPLVELRPDPDESPLGLVNNLREAMIEAAKLIPRATVKWKGGSMPFRPYCTGGHIHFSGIPFSGHFVRVLDNYIGLPLMLLEDRTTAELRRPRYGFLGDVRHKAYGGFEYRTPSSFIVDPTVTTAAFCLAYVIAVHHREIPIKDIYAPSLQHAFYTGDTESIRPIVLKNLDSLRTLPTFERYRPFIQPLIEMIERGDTWDENIDIRTVWGIPIQQQSRRSGTARRRRSPARSTG